MAMPQAEVYQRVTEMKNEREATSSTTTPSRRRPRCSKDGVPQDRVQRPWVRGKQAGPHRQGQGKAKRAKGGRSDGARVDGRWLGRKALPARVVADQNAADRR